MSKPEEMPVCPVCGDDTNDFYVSDDGGEVLGCPHCVKLTDAWEYTEAQRLSAEIDRYIDREKDRGFQ